MYLLFSSEFLHYSGVETSVYGGVEQLVARKAHNLEVVGSSPTFRTHGDKSSILVLFDMVVVLFISDHGNSKNEDSTVKEFWFILSFFSLTGVESS